MNSHGRPVVALPTRVRAFALALLMCASVAAHAAEVNMAEVRRLAEEPVETIFAGAPIGRLTAADYSKNVQGSSKPVVVVFYANQDSKSRNLATLVRYLALEFGKDIVFYGYQVSDGTTVERNELQRLQKNYGIRQVPATLFYDNDRGKIELEKKDYAVPVLAEYRTPSMFLWNTYFRTVREYIQKNILD